MDDATERLLRRTLAGAAAATTIPEHADGADPDHRMVSTEPLIATADGRGHAGWLAAAAAAVLVIVVAGAAAFGRGDREGTPTTIAASADPGAVGGGGAPSTAPGVGAGPGRVPTFSFSSLPPGVEVSAPRPLSRPEILPHDEVPVAYEQQIGGPAAPIDVVLSVSAWAEGSAPANDGLHADAAPDPTVEIVVSGGLGPDSVLYLHPDGVAPGGGAETARWSYTYVDGDPSTQAFGTGEGFALSIWGRASMEDLSALAEVIRFDGWVDLASLLGGGVGTIPTTWTIPMPGDAPTVVDGTAVPAPTVPFPAAPPVTGGMAGTDGAPGTKDIWPTEAPTDYCAGWKAFMDVQFTAPGPQSVQTEGFRRYTEQLASIAPGDLPDAFRTIRERWSSPDKASIDDSADGTDVIFQHIYEVSTATCPA